MSYNEKLLWVSGQFKMSFFFFPFVLLPLYRSIRFSFSQYVNSEYANAFHILLGLTNFTITYTFTLKHILFHMFHTCFYTTLWALPFS